MIAQLGLRVYAPRMTRLMLGLFPAAQARLHRLVPGVRQGLVCGCLACGSGLSEGLCCVLDHCGMCGG